ncbi:MAG: serpin family protein [Myxococcota bacterium]|nr:serpin family protein [Myxococcota bacterium]
MMITLACVGSLWGCGGQESAPSTPGTPPSAEEQPPAAPEATPTPEPEPEGDPEMPAARVLTDEEERTVGRAVNGLGADLFARLAAQPGNVALSPASIEAALAMTTAGARGPTQEEMLRVLHAEEPAIDAIGQALRRWDDPDRETYTLRVANRLFAEDRYTFEEAYLARVRAAFAAPVERLDFVGAADPSRQRINGWVAEHTRDRIRDLIPSGAIDPDTRLVLVNAVYLDASWQAPFDRAQTRPASFRVDGGTAAQVDTMHRTARMALGVIDGATVIELPYRGDEIAMRFVLPAEGTAPAAWATEAHLSDAAQLTERRVELSIPKFRIETASIPLSDHLQAMGMSLAFDPAQADFTGMANPPSPADRLYISSAFHKAFVRVDEEGTEAAAATAVIMSTRGMAAPEPDPIRVRFDRPFLFVLRDLRTGAVLFLGRVSDPR